MKFWVSRFQKSLRHRLNDVHTLWWALAPRRSDDAAEPGDLDRFGVCYLDGQDSGAIVIANGRAFGRYRDLETPAVRSRIRRAGYC